MRNCSLKILLEIVNENLRKTGLGEASSVRVDDNIVYAFWNEETCAVGFLPSLGKNVKESFIYSPSFRRKF